MEKISKNRNMKGKYIRPLKINTFPAILPIYLFFIDFLNLKHSLLLGPCKSDKMQYLSDEKEVLKKKVGDDDADDAFRM